MTHIKFQGPAQAARERELIKNPRPFVARTVIRENTMQATVYPGTGAVLLNMDTGQSVALTSEEAAVLRDLLVAELPQRKKDEEPNAG